METLVSFIMNRRLLFFVLLLFLVGCEKEVYYLPGFKFVDGSNCHIESSEFDSPLIVSLVKGYNLEISNDKLFMEDIQSATERGCDVNEPDSDGLSSLNTAILFSQYRVIEKLIEYGADPYIPVNSHKKSFTGMDSFQFSHWLIKRDPSKDREKINLLINKYK